MKMGKIRILLADDQLLFARSLKTVIEIVAPDFTVTSVVPNGETAIREVDADPPDIVLMDIRMPIMDGVEATRRIRLAHPEVKVMVLTTFESDAYVQQAIRNGASGYLLKDIPPEELVAAIRAVLLGVVPLAPSIAASLVHKAGRAESPSESPSEDLLLKAYQSLTERERSILALISEGLRNKEIGARLFLAEQTVKNSVSEVLGKFGAKSRSQLILIQQRLRPRA